MSSLVLTDAVAWVGGLALTTYSNELSVKTDAEDKDVTTFGGGGFRSRIAGLRDVDASIKGFWESAVDADGWTQLGVADQVCTFAPTSTETNPCVMFQAGNFDYTTGGAVGDVNPFEIGMSGTNGVGAVYGQIAKTKGNVSATGAIGSALNLGAVSSTQYVYGAVHVFTAGTTITLKIQSDDNSGFTSPTDRITLTAITATGGTWVTRLAGAITDTYWRYNVSAVTGTFNLAASIGIA